MSNSISFEEYLADHETLTYTNVGVSMLPLLRQGQDLFTVRRKGSERCQKGDVVLYRRPPDQHVLHRIVEVRPDSYVILGDNCVAKEYGIQDEAILGVMTGYVRNGREHTTRECGYRMYTFLMLHTIGLRLFLKRCRAKAAACAKKLLRRK